MDVERAHSRLEHVRQAVAAVEGLVANLRQTKTVTDRYVRWQLAPPAASPFAFEIFVYLDDGEPQVVAVTRQAPYDSSSVWCRPFEIADYPSRETQFATFLEISRLLLTHHTKLQWRKRLMATSVTCSYMDDAGNWKPIWTTVWARTASRPPLGSLDDEGAWEAGPVATLEFGALRPAP